MSTQPLAANKFRFLFAAAALLLALSAQAGTQPLVGAKFREFDAIGLPLSGGLLYTYAAGTTTPQATYTDSTGNVANANPVVLDSTGRADVWLTPTLSYKLVLKDASGNLLYTEDNFPASTTQTSSNAFTSPVTINVSLTTGVGLTVTGDPNGNSAVVATSGNSSSNVGATGWAAGQFTGGNQTVAGRQGGYALISQGGAGNGSGTGGRGLHATGGQGGATGTGGTAVRAIAGAGGATSGAGGMAVVASGGAGTAGNGAGGDALSATGGNGNGSGTGGNGLTVTGGSSGSGTGGNGLTATGGSSGSGTGGVAVSGAGAGTSAGGTFANGTAATGATRQDALAVTNGDISMDGVAIPNSTVAVKNRLTPGNIVKAYVNLTTVTGNPTVNGAFNISSATCASSNITINYAQAFLSASSYVITCSGGGSAGQVQLASVNSGSAVIAAYSTTGVQINLCVPSVPIYCIAVGAQ